MIAITLPKTTALELDLKCVRIEWPVETNSVYNANKCEFVYRGRCLNDKIYSTTSSKRRSKPLRFSEDNFSEIAFQNPNEFWRYLNLEESSNYYRLSLVNGLYRL
ncbi:uncharacterized protein VTP21DRAFT_2551 [Calcarisporiella thermophila]|uniref:uncharacterized protein n=1 Tax=Calcarisporiella thermophila TaxID=911321 RepID=UPI00374369FA